MPHLTPLFRGGANQWLILRRGIREKGGHNSQNLKSLGVAARQGLSSYPVGPWGLVERRKENGKQRREERKKQRKFLENKEQKNPIKSSKLASQFLLKHSVA